MVHLLRVVVVVIAVETFFELPFGFLLFPNSRCWKCRKPDLKLYLILKSSHFSRTCGWRLENTKKPWVFSITNDYFTFYEIFGKKPLHLQSNNSDGKVKFSASQSDVMRLKSIEKAVVFRQDWISYHFQCSTPIPIYNKHIRIGPVANSCLAVHQQIVRIHRGFIWDPHL